MRSIWDYRYRLRIFIGDGLGRLSRGATGRKGDHGMKNVEMTVEGNILTIKVDLTKDFGPSSSKKSIIIASTEGNVSVPNREEKVGLNVYRTK
jgi:hypothetical protein